MLDNEKILSVCSPKNMVGGPYEVSIRLTTGQS